MEVFLFFFFFLYFFFLVLKYTYIHLLAFVSHLICSHIVQLNSCILQIEVINRAKACKKPKKEIKNT